MYKEAADPRKDNEKKNPSIRIPSQSLSLYCCVAGNVECWDKFSLFSISFFGQAQSLDCQ
jgi:hypothetical protein